MTQSPDITSATIRKRTIDEELAIPPLPSGFEALQRMGLLVGGACLILCILGIFFGPLGGKAMFFRAYLFAWLFWLGVALGSLAWVMVHHLTGGDWGLALFRPAEAASRTLPLMGLLIAPVLMGYKHLFPWANIEAPDLHISDETRRALIHQNQVWFSLSGYILRAAICFAIWCALAFWLSRRSIELDRTDDLYLARRIRKVCSFGVVAYILTMTLGAFDWIMAREAAWFSSILPFIVVVGQAMSALVFLIILQRLLVRFRPFGEEVTPNVLNDLGNLFLTCTILWAYMSFAQLLIIWMGNTKVDTPWYVRRGFGIPANGWALIALLLLLFHFFVPFILLLMRWTKRHLDRLTTLAMIALVARLVDVYWLSSPSSMEPLFRGFRVSWMDILMPLGIGGIWIFTFVAILASRPLLSHLHPDPRDMDMETPQEHARHARPAHGH
jgi:hypothetical protein